MSYRSFASRAGTAALLCAVALTVLARPASAAEPRNVFAYGHAPFFGSTGTASSHSIVGIAASPSGRGYRLVASDGAMFAFGDARFLGSAGGMHLNEPIVGMAATPSGRGYWLVASDGGIFAFGNARFRGAPSARGQRIVGMAATRSGHGYWLASDNGRVFAFGDAAKLTRVGSSRGTAGNVARVAPGSIVGIAASRTTRGFWLAADGDAGRKVEAAVAWFESRLGDTSYEGLCETTVELAYGTIEKYPTASADWRAQPNKHVDWWNAPRGALVFYNTSADGHVALSLGNGQVVSSSVNHHIDVAQVGFFQNPLGWAPAPW
jgi:hypothetical protein